MLAGWVSSTTSATQNTITNKTTEGVACAAAEIVIDDVYAGKGSGGIARAIVRNSGGTDNLAITSAQLYDKFGNNFTTVSSLPTSLNKGQMATLNFNYSILPTTTNDSAHGINNGTLMEGPLYTLGGKYGSALSFDGVDDVVNITTLTPSLNITGNVTVAAWIKWAGGGCIFGGIVNRRVQNTDDMISLYAGDVGSDGLADAGFSIETSTTNWNTSNMIDTIPSNTWVYIAGTYNESMIVGYENGIIINTTNQSGQINTPLSTWVIGSLGSFGGCYFNGIIDDVAIWNRSLTNAEINISMNSGPLTVSNTNDLVAYWKFDEGKGVLSCPSDFSRVVVTTNCGGVSAEFSKPPKC